MSSFSLFGALLFGALCVSWRVQAHVDTYVIACQTGDVDPEDEKEFDGDEIVYIDLKKQAWVGTMPDFLQQLDGSNLIQQALTEQQTCKNNLDVLVQAENSPPEEIDSPQVAVYPRDEVSVERSNILICSANNFFPPPVKVKWTKNNVEVTEGVTLSRYYPNKDFTYRQYSTLPFIPQEGDVYACAVEHKGLSQPETKFWDVEIQEASDIGKTVYCGVGLTLGLLGVGVGTFFLIKGNNCQ